MPNSNSWHEAIKRRHPEDDGFLPYWNFTKHDGTRHYTIDPHNIPEDWKDLTSPKNVFEIPEVWYGVQRIINPGLDVQAWHEVEFCLKLWEKYLDKKVDTVFEVCCGICPHGSLLARKKFNVVGVDASTGMVQAVQTRSESQQLPIKAYRRDIFQFSIPGSSPDAALLLGRTFPVAPNIRIDNTALVNLLRSVGTFLKRGSLCIIDLGSFENYQIVNEYSMSAPEVIDIGYAKVTRTLRTFPTHMETLSTPYVEGYDVDYPGGRVRLELKGVRGHVPPQHFTALVEMSRVFTLENFHHWGRLEPGLSPDGSSYLAVLRRC